MNRIKKLFCEPKEKLIPFFTAGYPKLDSTIKLVCAAADAGADMVEIGIPFSDPQADGPVIQASSQQALDNGMTLNIIFEQIIEIRKKTDVPIALMGYYNPILKMGHETFLNNCVSSGVDGLILPDLPLEEAVPFCELAKEKGISPILLVAPNTPDNRIKNISKLAGDLIYAVSILGITGNDLASKDALSEYLNRVRENSITPFVVGFGIGSREDVIWFNEHSDGAVVGSAIIKNMSSDSNPVQPVKTFIQKLKGTV
ncbi:MAG: tryptophan synthase subunit alpha [Candidatus Marinimicrobia bacterium]|jgi:tryptophan synthase alpha chain|nr:tryptophan synthase subunit alpha [Candidatus Neomarinimicrobiota bacterium]MBT3839286.1 tryptophan synthase subunit alpha [Candidatus Neomarinimicrobiota bacterium]MBT3999247.1 tryptophan synthase subunit alpha [Candidatus Neomarinimicrobiota bacterium]MBT4281947.1 tryptophan synthase subunit alpha [Candidatus Neomarinimicrobiota bacterium]MBT4579585.1 tryptophan synthase subunit alpha [Candidatus Neomarinimicrobiota bacterium]